MNKKPKLVYGIKGKLVSAACMLLVAVIMVVSSTYAWFTLSTAPEVTGIQTAVGANGSLEMALLPDNGDVNSITSNVGDGAANADWADKNLTWGNLVDLSTGYGLDKIILYPSALNNTGNTLSGNMLSVPVYGADGRVSELATNKTVTGKYVAGQGTGSFPVSTTGGFGVRAVGVASGMTERQLDYRNAISSATTLKSQAADAAATSMNEHGSSLATILSTKAMDGKFTQTDVENLLALVESIKVPLNYIDQAYMQYILAYAASKSSTDEAWTGVSALVNAQNATLSTVMAGLSGAGVTLPGELTTPITALQATQKNVDDAETKLQELKTGGSNEIEWNSLTPALYLLANMDMITLNGYTADNVRENLSDIINKVASEGARVDMKTGGGVYADIADHCGDYTASVKIESITYNNLELTNVNAKMYADSTLPTPYLTACGAAVNALGAPESGNATMPISEFYGYVIDMAFRTNAAESSLLLQTTPVDRIYEGNANESTMGHGSTMTFVSTTNDFTNDQVKILMGAMRVVFFIPGATTQDSSTIVAYAKLDMASAKVGAEGVTANLHLYTTVTTYHLEDGTEVFKNGDKYYTDTTYATEVSETVTPKESEILITESKDAKIMDLVQNASTKLSALVYLDGNNITNKEVAAKAQTSMTGKLNLQFSSSATLSPMEYADLHQPAQGDGN